MPLKFYAYVGGALALLAAVSWLYFKGVHDERGRLQPKLDAATWQAGIYQRNAEVEASRATNTRKAYSAAEEGRHAIDQAPDLDGALDDFSAALGRVRASGHEPVSQPVAGRPDAGR